MKTIIRPVDVAIGIYRVAIRITKDGAHTWHRYRGTRAGAIAFCERHKREYTVAE